MKTAKTVAYYFCFATVLIVALMLFKASALSAVHHPDRSFDYTLLSLLIFFFGQNVLTFLEDVKYQNKHNSTPKSIVLSIAIRFVCFAIAHICATQAEYAATTFLYALLDAIAYFCFLFGRTIANEVREQRLLS